MIIRILLADDHKITRQGLINMLNTQPEMEVIGEADNGRKALQMTRQLSPDVVIMDVLMPELNGIDATHMITKEFRGSKVIALTMYADKRFVRGMIQAGAAGYVLKSCGFEELVRAIRCVADGKTYLCPEIASILLEDYVTKKTNGNPVDSPKLTVREREVLQLIAEGLSTKKISSHLNVSVKTIETHRRQIMEKLNASSVAELTKYAVREGLTPLEA